MKRKYLRLPPELTDGQHTTYHRRGDEWSPQILGETLEEWMRESDPGDEITLRVVEMTDEEWEQIPEM